MINRLGNMSNTTVKTMPKVCTREVHNYVYFTSDRNNDTVKYIEQLASNLNLTHSKTTLISTIHSVPGRDGFCNKMAITVSGNGNQVVKFIAEADRLFKGDK